ncbi:MAG: 50S ribosomal protein L1 [Candidatus Aenigmarchaeota archaeon]|nr:50S ribosomal protein L1 [Candidatus Aenigmarchaeota archaeon]
MDDDLKKKLEERKKQIEEQLAKQAAAEKPIAHPVEPQSEVPAEAPPAEKPKAPRKRKAAKPEAVEPTPAVTPAQAAAPAEKPKPAVPKPRPKPKPEVQKPPAPIYPFAQGIAEARKLAKKRKFSQSWDLIISLKGMDMKKPENRLNLDFALPEGRGKLLKVGMFADTLAASAQEKGVELVIRKEEIPELAKDAKKLKKAVDSVDWIFGEVTLMADIGKRMGAILGPRGKVPKPIPPKVDIAGFVRRARTSVPIVVKESPVIHVPIGTEEMTDDAVLKNLQGVYAFVKEKLPKGVNSIRSVHLKLTMGSPVKLEVK